MVRNAIGAVAAVGAVLAAAGAQAETWRGCVGIANTSGVDVKVRLDAYPGWHWDVAASDRDVRYLKHDNQVPIMEGNSHDRPPIHVEPQNIGMMWNFFTGEHDPENNCANAWRIVIMQSPCRSVVDNICR